MQAILFDMDGVLYVGDRPIDGAAATLEWCRRRAIPFRFVTNTTSRPRVALVEKLQGMGIEASEEEIVTPPIVARRWLTQQADGPVGLFVPAPTEQDFAALRHARSEEDPVSAVVLGDLGDGWDFATYNRAFRWLKKNPDAALVALGMTRFWEAEDGPRLDVGPFVRGLEYALDRKAVVLGKPSASFFRLAIEEMGARVDQAAMIGDDIMGDIDGAQQAGLRAVQVRTGKFRPQDLERGISPDGVIDSIADLPAWWQHESSR
ncbi:TIGR01458 family HAD-type hydrolase [Guyparkeria halophila]|uniref:Haloacid dehalogenase-like hydrolase domain-containing protein 2 n=1 Tax=Guyparkeria halophila TaxID=47960 RepID=A0ABZ0YV47_9GAMM|nr:TIGR01458 family HAD-type hydrolase [Guyparkeria halophila]WQH16050.1 TIGR01458 family HAD-type hydrolase [Guyparkeria halophila]